MLKKILYISICILLAACMSPRKMVVRGMYDAAIYKAVKKIKKHPSREKHIQAVTDAFRLANQANNDRIKFLRQEGRPDTWDEILVNYSALKMRQDVVKTLPTNVLNRIGYSFIDYDKEIISSKQKAADYNYAHAVELLKTNNKADARNAYDELMQIKKYYNSYKDVDALIQKSINIGTSYILFKLENKSLIQLPPKFEDELLKISLSEFNDVWHNYDTRTVSGRNYDYTIWVKIKLVTFTPESVKENSYTETKDVENGWQYALDKNGNVMKDSLGNDIKIKKYKTITCTVKETVMKKSASLIGTIDFIENNTNQLIKTNPLTADAIFDYAYATAYGDKDALKEETKKKLRQPVPFPSTPELLLMAVETMKSASKSIVSNYRSLFY
ncbi:MAG: hypothetical protein PHD97_06510 [Bacteroidales bacterium]|nr:hypothetical protein [Bacteroidales bacterium]